MIQYHGTYVGPREDLKDKRAIIKVEEHFVQDMIPAHGHKIGESVTAQFDDLDLPESHGWHTFKRSDFVFEYQYGGSEE